MTCIDKNAINSAAIAYCEAEVLNGSGSHHDNVEAAIRSYLDAANEYAPSTAVLGIGDDQLQAVEDSISERITGNGELREKARKFFDNVLCELLDGFETHFANDTRWNLDRLIVTKAKLLVDALLRGDESVMNSFVGWSYQQKTRRAVLSAIGDYAAKTEVEDLRDRVIELEKRLKWREA
jgi:hypothetical protein